MQEKNTSRKPILRLLLGATVGFALLGWLLHKAGWRDVAQSMKEFSAGSVLLMIAITYVSLPLRVGQWRALLGHPSRLTWTQTFRALCVGYVGNGVLPAGGGEFLKAYSLNRSANLGFARILGSIVLIRMQDLLPVLLITTAVLGILPLTDDVKASIGRLYPAASSLPDTELRFLLRLLSISGVGAIVVLFMAFLHRKAARRIALSLLSRLSERAAARCDDLLTRVDAAVGTLGHTRYFLEGQAYAVGCWTVFVMAPIPLLMELGLAPQQAFLSSLAVNGLATITLFVPIAPAGVGVYHTACGFALLSFNPSLSENAAVAYAVMSHLVSLSPLVLSLAYLFFTHSMGEALHPAEMSAERSEEGGAK